MTHFHKLKVPSFLNCLSSLLHEKHVTLSKISSLRLTGSLCTARVPSSCHNHAAIHTSGASISEAGSASDSIAATRIPNTFRKRAQAALLDYLHGTRGLDFTDADHMSKHSPNFLWKILKRVKNENDIGQSVARFLRYHPINEFEPFFESLGLNPSEVSLFLPRDLMFLCDNDVLLENFHALCNYGIPRRKIGKIYKEAREIFLYHYGVLCSKLRAYEELGLSKTSVIKLAVSSPSLLIGNVDREFVKVLEELKGMGVEHDRIICCLSEENLYDWKNVLRVLEFFEVVGFSKEQLGVVFSKNPSILLESLGMKAYALIVLLVKFGITMKEIINLLLQIPPVQPGIFVKNMRQSLMFLIENEMEVNEIGKIVRTYPQMLGSCSLKRGNTVREKLNIGKKRLCGIVKEDPTQLKNWVLGSKLTPLPNNSKDKKTEFLVSLGFVVGSRTMEKALRTCRGKGDELQERFNCFVKAGLDPNDVSKMIKDNPNILNQSTYVIEKKIDFLVKDVGYPIETLVVFPSYVSYTIDRVKLRFSMYNWLKDKGVVKSQLALSTILACSEKIFLRQFVSNHPKGPEVWENFKKESWAG